ncbi:hypothetical protein COW09_02005 [bacterium (Candidatus Moisslbacteria) CG12_big_fil_rev_8_21_14_0_65_36_11]|nr:hypothetical protein [Candidatus Kuenenbacteria bacterium]OIP76605.1 MAG: hypothetical protein AUK09_01475 [Parcubacteria group bacterium CG2_30_36_38]PIV46116.1 MAG: hypothetical protein COS23_00765 [bacterium (Candidatus Moisslbacteria) CG02_land_8_20_14_3_00_36_53]PIW67675.1 MAG: hypothetical protein COW09_02005 [bacterium (Candidatus Moisslbacteria) CG12_big_fil_rev_8_21_14_0_65_36_11]PIZ90348.1 MAG: hypothetical protein COX87_01060 [bacterium (Candidatus Moisslbacteria) CG_4_10_14_0_2_u
MFYLGLFIGIFIGLIIGLFLAPGRGGEIRKNFKNRTDEIQEKVLVKIDRVKEKLRKVKKIAQYELEKDMEEVKGAFNNGKNKK